MKTSELYITPASLAYPFLKECEYPYEALSLIKEWILEIGSTLSEKEYEKIGDDIWISRSATVFPSAYITGPCIIGHNTEVRHSAFIRGSVLVGDNAVVGNSTELKNCILFDSVEVPHFNYVGDSILGYKAHMGAGSITSNVKGNKSNIIIDSRDTKRYKAGAFLGDKAEIGCNSVLNPGTIIGPYSQVYPCSSVRGVVRANAIYKSRTEIVEKRGDLK